jgi:hypothetical protein
MQTQGDHKMATVSSLVNIQTLEKEVMIDY